MTGGGDEQHSQSVERLQERVAALENDLETVLNRDVPLLIAAIRTLCDEDVESVVDLPDIARAEATRRQEEAQRLTALEERMRRLGDVGSEPTSKDEKMAAVLAFAANKSSGTGKVRVTPHEITGCTGVSRRYAYDLLGEIAGNVDGVTVREGQDVQTSTGTKHKGKALLVDCEAVQQAHGGVNDFTTGDEVRGAE